MKKLVSVWILLNIGMPVFGKENEAFYSKLLSYIPILIGEKKLPKVNDFKYNDDCSGFIAFLFHASGLNLLKVYGQGKNGVSAVWDGLNQNNLILDHIRLQPGDIVFFDNTYDMNKNGRWDDELSHIGVVESIDDNDTVTYVHFASRGVVRSKMNLKYPETFSQTKDGIAYRYNDLLRNSSIRGVNPKYLSGSLYRGAARLPVAKKN